MKKSKSFTELNRIVRDGSKVGIDASEKLTMADFKRCVADIKKSATPLYNLDYFLVLPQEYKKYPKELEKVVNSYKKAGIKVVVMFNQRVPHGKRIA